MTPVEHPVTVVRAGTRARMAAARLISEALAPPQVAAALLITESLHHAASVGRALLWSVLASLFVAVVPVGYILHGVRRRQLTDHHIVLREQRPIPLMFGIVSVLAGIGVLSLLGAPRALTALVAAMGMGLSVSLLLTLFWKVSLHSATAAGALVVLLIEFGPLLLPLGFIVGFIGWARVQLGVHTPSQVIMGGAVGMAIAGFFFAILR